MTTTPNLDLPYLAAGQAQKHVALNESLRRLDALVQIGIEDRDLTAPPASPAEGARYLVAAGATGAWAGRSGQIAAFQDGGWSYLAPRKGWIVWIGDEQAAIAFDGTQWRALGGGSGGSSTEQTWVLIQHQVANNVASVDFTSGFSSTYDWYCLHVGNLQPATDNQYMRVRMRPPGGDFRSAAGDYRWARYAALSNGAFGGDSSNGTQSGLAIGVPLGNGQQAIAKIELARPTSVQIQNLFYQVISRDNAGNACTAVGGGALQHIEAIDGIRFYMDSGLIRTGSFSLYGKRNGAM